MMIKETVVSIRGWFYFWGVVGVVSGLWGLIQSPQDIVSVVFPSIYLSLGIGFLFSGYEFPEFFHTSTKSVQYLLYAVIWMSVLQLLFVVLQGDFGISLFEPILTLMIGWYLLLNVKRLGEEYGLDGSQSPHIIWIHHHQ